MLCAHQRRICKKKFKSTQFMKIAYDKLKLIFFLFINLLIVYVCKMFKINQDEEVKLNHMADENGPELICIFQQLSRSKLNNNFLFFPFKLKLKTKEMLYKEGEEEEKLKYNSRESFILHSAHRMLLAESEFF